LLCPDQSQTYEIKCPHILQRVDRLSFRSLTAPLTVAKFTFYTRISACDLGGEGGGRGEAVGLCAENPWRCQRRRTAAARPLPSIASRRVLPKADPGPKRSALPASVAPYRLFRGPSRRGAPRRGVAPALPAWPFRGRRESSRRGGREAAVFPPLDLIRFAGETRAVPSSAQLSPSPSLPLQAGCVCVCVLSGNTSDRKVESL